MPALQRILRIGAWVAGVVVFLSLGLAAFVELRWDAQVDRLAPVLQAPSDSASIVRGAYIFKFQAQCWGCHQNSAGDSDAPPSGGMLFDLSNTGPGFGKWYSRNLTPDVETGLGGWTDGEIVQALREGISKDRTTLFPIMSTDWYHGLSDTDVLALVAYMRSIPPVRNEVPQREPSFMAKALFTFKLMKPKDPITTTVTAPPRGITPEYGHYLANNLAGCADCHTPRNLEDGQFYMDSLFAGSSFAFGEGEPEGVASFARNITPDEETGIGLWTEEQFIAAVTAGMRPDGTVLNAHMPYAYYKFWTPEDLKALFLYLRTLPPLRRTVPPNAPGLGIKGARGAERGRLLFKTRCQTCHGENGSGARPTEVKLAEVAGSLNDADLREFIATGQLNLNMPAFGKTLNDEEMTDLITFIRTWEPQ